MFSFDIKNNNRLLVEYFLGLLICIMSFVTLFSNRSLKFTFVADFWQM